MFGDISFVSLLVSGIHMQNLRYIVGQSVKKNGPEIASENNELGAEHWRSVPKQSGAGEMKLEGGIRFPPTQWLLICRRSR